MAISVGRTTCIALKSIALAIENPGKSYKLKDHDGGNTDELAQYIQHVAVKLNLTNISVKMSGNSYTITSHKIGGYDN